MDALFHGPGQYSAVAIYRGLFEVSKHKGCLIGHSETQTFVQVAAETREEMLLALRVTRPEGFLDEEVIGGRIADGREPFGFRDGLRAPSQEEIQRLAVGPDGTWLLYMRFEQDLERFAALNVCKQENVIGRTPDGIEVPHAPKDAHVQSMREWNRFIRRGFPYRKDGKEGLVFIAAARDPKVFAPAIAAFEKDALYRYAREVSREVFHVR